MPYVILAVGYALIGAVETANDYYQIANAFGAPQDMINSILKDFQPKKGDKQ